MCNFVIDFEANQQRRIADCLPMLNINRLPIDTSTADTSLSMASRIWRGHFLSVYILGTATGLILYCHY